MTEQGHPPADLQEICRAIDEYINTPPTTPTRPQHQQAPASPGIHPGRVQQVTFPVQPPTNQQAQQQHKRTITIGCSRALRYTYFTTQQNIEAHCAYDFDVSLATTGIDILDFSGLCVALSQASSTFVAASLLLRHDILATISRQEMRVIDHEGRQYVHLAFAVPKQGNFGTLSLAAAFNEILTVRVVVVEPLGSDLFLNIDGFMLSPQERTRLHQQQETPQRLHLHWSGSSHMTEGVVFRGKMHYSSLQPWRPTFTGPPMRPTPAHTYDPTLPQTHGAYDPAAPTL